MAVLVEVTSVIVRRAAIEKCFAGGWDGFVNQVPNSTFCSDDDLARVGFMSATDVKAYAATLEDGGLIFCKDGEAVDFAVVDQLKGATVPAPWLEFGMIEKFATPETGEIKISACWLVGQSPNKIALPAGWEYENFIR